MPEFQFSFDQAYAYFTYRLPLEKISQRDGVVVHCPFHADKNPSLSLNLKHGVWHCHGCNLSGGILDFERRMMASDVDTAWKQIAKITGVTPPRRDRTLVATYNYCDVRGQLLYQKQRWEPKNFSQRRPDGKNGWVYNLDGVKKVLYNLPRVLVSKVVIVVEGEKDADNLNKILPAEWAATTNFDGAGKWKQDYAAYFAGKLGIVLGDNDEVGEKHAEQVAASIAQHADRVKRVRIPDVKDISEWLDASFVKHGDVGKMFTDFSALVAAAPLWQAKKAEHVLLAEVQDFLSTVTPEVEWLVDGVIPSGANGILAADPKVGKSLVAISLAMSLATGVPWMGFGIPRRRRVGLVSREDFPGETARRMHSLATGEKALGDYQWGQIWVNTRWQSETFWLTDKEQMDQLIAELRMEQIDLVIFDVFRRMHLADENDNTAMAAVVDKLTRVQAEVGCSVVLVHHLSKLRSSNLFRDVRGASAIHGWTEWGMGLTVANEEDNRRDWIRKAEFEVKCACPADPVHFRFIGPNEAVRIELTEAPTNKKKPTPISGGRNWYDKDEEVRI